MSALRWGNRRGPIAAFAVFGIFAAGATAYALTGSIDSWATAERQAVRIVVVGQDTAVVADVGDVDPFVVDATAVAANLAGGLSAPARTGSLGMQRITRSGTVVHAPPSGYLIPMIYIAMPTAAIVGTMGTDVANVLDASSVVVNQVTADITGAQVGDVIDMQAADGSVQPFLISGIRPYDQIGGSELVITIDGALRLGATADTEVVVWGFGFRSLLDQALIDVGVTGRQDTRVLRSWDSPSPDSTLSTAHTKVLLGEPWFRFLSDDSIAMHPDWEAANLSPTRIVLDPNIPIRARCHLKIVADLSAALAEVAGAGLAGAIEVGNANTYGGCYNPRFTRTSGEIGFLSRHSYGMALDTNTQSNCQGCVPAMNCTVVRIFRKHNFAWGGNFRRSDGMHFEWVGEPRDRISFPSKYCPNLSSPLTESTSSETLGLDVLLAGQEAIIAGHVHAP
jgi:hypothetical protein